MNRAAAYFMTLYTVVGNRFQDRKDRGATAVEYGLMVGLIAVGIIVAVTALKDNLNDLFDAIGGKLGEAAEEAAG